MGVVIPKSRSEKIRAFTVEEVEASEKQHLLQASTPLPAYVNWWQAGKVSRPYNQKMCGSCWAFSAASAMESLAAINGSDATV